MSLRRSALLLIVLISLVTLSSDAVAPPGQRASSSETDVTRATLENGLRVVIIRNALAPVVSIYQNYLVGANETPRRANSSAGR